MGAGEKVRIAVVGGGFGCDFFWHEDPDCVVQAVSDPRPASLERLVRTYGCSTTYASLAEVLQDRDVDAVAIFTGAPDHAKHAIQALKAGKHVFCAVPAAMNLEQAEELLDTVRSTGLTYMMAETSYYHQAMISAREWYARGDFGEIFYTEAEYHHSGLDTIFMDSDGRRTWRYALPPMLYPTHSTAFLVGLTGERLVEVTCIGWGDGSDYLQDNAYANPFGNETALFKTDSGHAFRAVVYWQGAHCFCERAQWYGSKMSFFSPNPNGLGPVIVRSGADGVKLEPYDQPRWWETMLPEPLRHGGGHDGAEPFLTHEFVDAIRHGRRPAIDIYEALAYTVPGIIAHQSALAGGAQMKIPTFDEPARHSLGWKSVR